jgi:predicted hotdog family 3-hydroxylacyl-ACP dehydratase
MCLNERILAWDDEHVRLATRTHAAIDNPLRAHGRLRALHLCEYGAQAMAVHGGLLARAQGRRAPPGLLVALRDVRLSVDYLERLDDEIEIEARRLLAGADSWQYAFRVTHAGQVLAEGRAAVILRAPPSA